MRLVLLLVFLLPIYLSAQDTESTAPKKDIFFIFDVYVKDKETGKPIPNCTVTLIGSDGTQIIKTTDSTGKISFDKNGEERYINKETSYNFEVFKKDYLSAKGKFSTVGETSSKRFVEEVYIMEKPSSPPRDLPEIQFSHKSTKLNYNVNNHDSKDSLDLYYQILIDNPTLIFEIQGHSDCSEKDFDKKLSQKRAQTCVDYLVSKGIPRERLVAVGYGSEQLRTFNYTCESINGLTNKAEKDKLQQMNRRVEFRVLRFDYKPTDN
jgi:outer membrane protein OmpA-like peptidoglycan-associated protein